MGENKKEVKGKKAEKLEKVKVQNFTPPKPAPATIKIIEVEMDKEFTEPEGWIIRETYILESKAILLVLVKLRQQPLRMSPPVNLKD